METNLISVEEICAYHQVEINFIQSLEDFGLIHTTIKKQSVFLPIDELSKLEQYLRLAQDLEINLEGIHAVSHLLSQLQNMQEEMTALRNELNYYKQLNKH
ncbi:chaperone modulator CbpM [Pedobacter roseus]|uniref:MerR family transcriptional regulator n=1 Tax=Pedobacter roseus TaxID=336820 RepID=A0A7G9QCD4_9SPHI|nr:chaperone modulator CbpM [Pedobacter roseus]QNN41009.1 MerR family transcriptional regulator [Pedobacter roseus]